MVCEWTKAFLGEVAEELTVGRVGPMATEYVTTGIPFLRSQNVEPLRLNDTDLKFISPEFHRRLRKSALSPGDVVIVRTGKPGACAVIPPSLPDANCSDLVIVRCGNGLDPRFLAYYVNTVASSHVNAHLVGAVQQHFNVGSARKLEMLLPPLPEQRRIASILGALDDKIELNRRMNRTLEEIAQAIFKSWFIDFGGQDDLVESELGLIPRGWEVGPLSRIARLATNTVNPGGQPDRLWEHYSIPAYDQVGRPTLDLGASIKSNKYEVGKTAVLVSKLNPAIQRVWLPDVHDGDAAICSTEFMPFTPLEPRWRPFVYELLNSDAIQANICGRVTGTTGSRQRVRPGDIANMMIALPPRDLIEGISGVIEPLHNRRLLNLRESATLAVLRDTLLPKLISGEIRVPEAEEILEEAL